MILTQKLFIKTLLFFYFFSTSLSATHLHELHHNSQHEDCSVCIVVNSLQSSDFDITLSTIPLLVFDCSLDDISYLVPITNKLKGYDSTAPPVLI